MAGLLAGGTGDVIDDEVEKQSVMREHRDIDDLLHESEDCDVEPISVLASLSSSSSSFSGFRDTLGVRETRWSVMGIIGGGVSLPTLNSSSSSSLFRQQSSSSEQDAREKRVGTAEAEDRTSSPHVTNR